MTHTHTLTHSLTHTHTHIHTHIATVVADTANQLLPNSLNLLASNLSNLKSAQTLLTALQKNLPSNSNFSANVKSLAARVLASPLRPTQSEHYNWQLKLKSSVR